MSQPARHRYHHYIKKQQQQQEGARDVRRLEPEGGHVLSVRLRPNPHVIAITITSRSSSSSGLERYRALSPKFSFLFFILLTLQGAYIPSFCLYPNPHIVTATITPKNSSSSRARDVVRLERKVCFYIYVYIFLYSINIYLQGQCQYLVCLHSTLLS